MDKKDKLILKKLTLAIEVYYQNYPKRLVRDFFSGVAYGLGATVGVAILLALLTFLLRQLGALPLIGEWFQVLFSQLTNR